MNSIISYKAVDVNSDGMVVRYKDSEVFICFAECAKNFAIEESLETNKCVATRDITKLTFTFYTDPKTEIVFKRSIFKTLLFGKSAYRNFRDLQKKINRCGFTTYDLS